MMIKLIEFLKKDDVFRYPYRGEVVDNVDPKKLGRVKCEITNFLEGSSTSLPWIYPRFRSNNNFIVPEIGEYVEIRFPYKDIYSGFYYGGWQDAGNHLTDFDELYPEVYGWKDSKGNKALVDKTADAFNIKLEDANGNKLTIDKGFLLDLLAQVKLTVSEEGDISLASNEDAGLKITKDGKVAIGSKNGSSTGGAAALEVVAILEKLCEYLSIEAPAGFGAPLLNAAMYGNLKADLGNLKGTL